MASMKLGSKSELFCLDANSWFCTTGLPSDVVIEIGEMSFHLHKFPLLSRSRVLEDLIGEHCNNDAKKCVLQLDDIPGGAKTFLYVAKFCYGVKIELSALNVVSLRCAAEYLGMKEDYGEGNLITQTENFLDEIFTSWRDSLKALETCEEVLPYAEELHIVSRCINSLAMKACADPSLFSWPTQTSKGTAFWNGINASAKPQPVGKDWWYDDASFLRLPMYKRLIMAVHSNGMKPEKLAGALMYYAGRHLPLLGRQSSLENGKHCEPGPSISNPVDVYQRNLLEEVVELLPDQKGVIPSNFLLRLLRTAMIMEVSPSCRESLEKQIGAQLDQSALEDILIPNIGYTVENLYDIDCVQRILDYFFLQYHDNPASNQIVNEGQITESSNSLTPTTMVANLIDNYLAEVAPDVNLKMTKFQSLAGAVPDYARALDDGIYRAIDIYLKAHPWLTDSEREQLCRLMNCQKLSLEASTHAAQNERLPLRVIVQVLFFEQLRLRTSIAGWFFVSDNLENSRDLSGNLALTRNEVQTEGRGTEDENIIQVDEMKDRVSELEKECLSMKEEIDKLVKTKGSTWNVLFRRFRFNKASKPSIPISKESPTSSTPLINRKEKYSDEIGC
ncbi:BTB/POZ domain-containing protein At5g03250-like [Euphorbia lathyris]|uniref:BTB/POZ domain-containing protein At5g03250-like n=1 Tax=Euphorbia lathyris TaxID=212925 RepID=UPI0033131891